MSIWANRALFASVIVAGGGYLLAAFFTGWADVISAFSRVGISGFVILLFLSLINYGMRFTRWQLYLKKMNHNVPLRRSLLIYLAGFALTTTPGKAGEAVRGVWLKRYGVPYPDTLAAFINERLSDLLAIALISLGGLYLFPSAIPYLIFGGALLLILPMIFFGFDRLAGHFQPTGRFGKHFVRWRDHCVEWAAQSQRCLRPKVFLLAMLLSLLGWLAEAYALALILEWMGYAKPFSFAAFVFAISMLIGALSFMPGGLGSTEVAMAALLVTGGISLADAAGATVLIRVATLWFAVGIGVLVQPFMPMQKTSHATG